MSDKSTIKKTLQSKAPSEPKASTPSSGGASAPGVSFDFCPTEFPENAPPGAAADESVAPAPDSGSAGTETATAGDKAAESPAATPPRESRPPSPAVETSAPKKEPLLKMERAEETKAKSAATESAALPPPVGPGSDFMAETTAQLSLRIFDMAQTNLNASFEFARQVAAARNLAEILELQTAYLQKQFAAARAQTEELAEFARKLSSIQTPGASRPH
jgi:phasin family protein